ncbi:MAG: ATP-binding protein [Alphaproteobacteria bacterium]|nr:MAG: ATP-binding protein [Alphaproteobacteria bacterium]
MLKTDAIYLGSSTHKNEPQYLQLKYANRHGLVAGATGTGKTVTLQNLAEGFVNAGVPVFMADVKGDLSGMCENGQMEDFLVKRAELIGLDEYAPQAMPVVFWDLYGDQGHPIRTTITEMGPILLARLLDLNNTQEGILNIVFTLAEDEKLPLLDLKDLRALLVNVSDRAAELSAEYGNVSKASVGAIQRGLLSLEAQGVDNFFGEPALNISDMMRTSLDGRGIANILAADKLIQSPKLYSTFLLWLLAELFEELPEAGDSDKPKLVFFFDEAHLLFKDAPKALLEKVEQVVRLIRSKGVGVYFITQTPSDVPESVLAQLANKIQHGLRAFTPKAQKTVRAAAQSFRKNPDLDTETVITELGIGEALVSTLEKKAIPSMVQQTMIRPPVSKLGPCSPEKRAAVRGASPVGAMYDTAVDRESAYEILKKKRAEAAEIAANENQTILGTAKKKKTSKRMGYVETAVKQVLRTLSSSIGREIVKIVLKSIRGR